MKHTLTFEIKKSKNAASIGEALGLDEDRTSELMEYAVRVVARHNTLIEAIEEIMNDKELNGNEKFAAILMATKHHAIIQLANMSVALMARYLADAVAAHLKAGGKIIVITHLDGNTEDGNDTAYM